MIILAPGASTWAARAEPQLAQAKLLVARLYEPSLLPLLLQTGLVRAIAIDAHLAEASTTMLRGLTISSRLEIIVVRDEDGEPGIRWPEDLTQVRLLMGLTR